mmetsp:Transcript_6840/g.12383  ORF Transcript_6840/g.12383 Transcript_6840/m.12383 type:complete len:281 (+) Transcript_6840:1942-2784(+)
MVKDFAPRGGSNFRGRGAPRGGGRGGRGPPRGGRRGGPGMRGGFKTLVEPHRFPGVFLMRGKDDSLLTLNMVPGESVYQEKRVKGKDEAGEPIEYRVWNPYRSKIASSILGGVEDIGIVPGCKVLYLGGASGTTVSHVSDILGSEGAVYAVEFSHRSGRDLVNMAKKRPNVVPIVDDARYPMRYRMLVPMVDTLFADVAQPDQARILGLNAQHFLKNGGHFMISIKANCIDSTLEPSVVFEQEIEKLREMGFKPTEMLTLEPFEIDHCVVTGKYRPDQSS